MLLEFCVSVEYALEFSWFVDFTPRPAACFMLSKEKPCNYTLVDFLEGVTETSMTS